MFDNDRKGPWVARDESQIKRKKTIHIKLTYLRNENIAFKYTMIRSSLFL